MARFTPLVLVVTVLLCVTRSLAARTLVQMDQQAAARQPGNTQVSLQPKPTSARVTPTTPATTPSSQSGLLGELASDAVKVAKEARDLAAELSNGAASTAETAAEAAAAAAGGATDAAADTADAADAAAAAAAVAVTVPAVASGAGAAVIGADAIDGIADMAEAGSSADAAGAVTAVAAADVANAASDAATDVAAHAAETAADSASDSESDDPEEEAERKALRDAELVWRRCVQSDKLGEVCVGVFVDSQQEPPLLLAQLDLRNHSFLLPLAKAKACLDDQLLLNLLLHDPKLAPFAAEIKAIMVLEKLTASDVISECVLFNSLSVTVDKPDSCLYISACPRLCSRLGCHRGHCLYSKDKEFECFQVRVPLHGRGQAVDVAVR